MITFKKYIDKDALVAEVKARISDIEVSQKAGLIKKRDADKKIILFKSVLSLIDTLEVKEVDLEKEVDDWYNTKASKEFENVLYRDIENCAKHFFELGMQVNNPITAADKGKADEIIFALKTLGEEKMISYDKEIEWLNKLKKL